VSYSVKEIFYTLQGEGAQAGRPAVFCRFSGCNLWSGHEEDRPEAVCDFCDTDFVGTDGSGGGKYGSAVELAHAINGHWPSDPRASINKLVVCTGGEPLLQLDTTLLEALQLIDFEVAVETNGTLLPPEGLDWICVSPKAGADLMLRSGDELKLVFPQPELLPEMFEGLAFEHFFLQPMDGEDLEANTAMALQYVLANPAWRLSLQIHKLLGIP
jgi:7-carboxy-7-deazaguanine synthase (Cx14CxxC type)